MERTPDERPEDRPEDKPPLLPGVAGMPGVARQLRASLETLRDHADPRTRERITAVLEGRASLRDVVREPAFGAFLGPLADAGWKKYQEMPEEDREAARVAIERDEVPEVPAGSEEPAAEEPSGRPGPASAGGTW